MWTFILLLIKGEHYCYPSGDTAPAETAAICSHLQEDRLSLQCGYLHFIIQMWHLQIYFKRYARHKVIMVKSVKVSLTGNQEGLKVHNVTSRGSTQPTECTGMFHDATLKHL